MLWRNVFFGAEIPNSRFVSSNASMASIKVLANRVVLARFCAVRSHMSWQKFGWPRALQEFAGNNAALIIYCQKSHLSGRGFFHANHLGLGDFEKQASVAEHWLRGRVSEREAEMQAKLENPKANFIYKDCVEYMSISKDIQTCVRVLERYNAQTEDERKLGLIKLVPREYQLVTTALRKCYIMNETDVAMEILKSTDYLAAGYITSLKLVMDLLYRNELCEKCSGLALDVVNSERIDINLSWFYSMGIMAAYKMNSSEGLNRAATLFDHSAKKYDGYDDDQIRNLQLLVSLYCIKQNHLQTAMTLLNHTDGSNDLEYLNIYIWVLLESGNLDKAITMLRTYAARQKRDESVDRDGNDTESMQVKKHPKKKKSMILYKDVFHQLVKAVGKDGGAENIRYREYLSHNHKELVSGHNVAYKLFFVIGRSHSRQPKRSQPGMTSDEETDIS